MNAEVYRFLLSMVALVICITIHEFAHAYAAFQAGDDTPRAQGRISLNPIDHLDPLGTVMMVVSSLSGFGIGWGKPVQINMFNFRNPRWDNLKVSLWGPLSNLIVAAVIGTVIRFLGPASITSNIGIFLDTLVWISIVLAVFNLIPIAPLDGSHILSSLLPYEQARRYDMLMGRWGMLIFIGLIMLRSGSSLDILGTILKPPSLFFYRLFTGL